MKWAARIGAVVVATIGALAGHDPVAAQAADAYPCGKEIQVSWSTEPVQPCPLTSPLANNVIPVYTAPVPNPSGKAPPSATAGVLHGISGKYFVCDRLFPKAMYYHPSGWRNNWWAYTRAENGHWGWVPEVFFKGGDNDEPDFGLRACEPPPPPTPPPPPPPAPAPLQPCQLSSVASGFKVKARFRHSRQVATARYGRKLRVRGRVVAPDGSPAAGAALCVGVQKRRDGPVVPKATVTANAKGHFTYKLGRGASRRVWFVHQVGGATAAAGVRVRVRAPVKLRASPRSLSNGQAVVLRGRLGGRARGLLVELQYARGGRWLNFATTRVRRGGRFRFAYRFTRTFSPRDYRFRARAPAQRNYPFAAGASHPVRVHVTG